MKEIRNYWIDYGCGFRVTIYDCPVNKLVNGIVTPDIDYNEYSKAVIFALMHKPAGSIWNKEHISFIRNYFEIDEKKFFKEMGTTKEVFMVKYFNTIVEVKQFLVERMSGTVCNFKYAIDVE